MLNPNINVVKLKNGVFIVQFAYFQDGRQNGRRIAISVKELISTMPNWYKSW